MATPLPRPAATRLTSLSHHRPRLERPEIQQKLASSNPRGWVKIPINEILGPDGHRHIAGYSLVTDGFANSEDAVINHRGWYGEVRTEMKDNNLTREQAEAKVEQESPTGDVPWVKPRVQPVESFEGGTCQVNFRNGANGREVSTICFNPPTRQP